MPIIGTCIPESVKLLRRTVRGARGSWKLTQTHCIPYAKSGPVGPGQPLERGSRSQLCSQDSPGLDPVCWKALPRGCFSVLLRWVLVELHVFVVLLLQRGLDAVLCKPRGANFWVAFVVSVSLEQASLELLVFFLFSSRGLYTWPKSASCL